MEYSESLKKSKEFKFVYNRGKSLANKFLVLYVCKNTKNMNRLGISVSKRVGNSVIRHRITRLIRESYRINEHMFKIGYDFVVIARNNAKCSGYKEIESALLHLGKLQNVIKEK